MRIGKAAGTTGGLPVFQDGFRRDVRSCRAMITRRTLLLGALATAAAGPALGLLRERDGARDRRRSYQALVDALIGAGALPGPPSAASAAADRLTALHAASLPARRREIDAVLDGLDRAQLARLAPPERLALLRGWAAAGGERRVLAARALALAGAAFGPADRPLPVVI